MRAHRSIRASAGLLLSIVIGAALGIGMAWSKPINVVLGPIVEIFYPLPKSALIPVTVIWLGLGDGSKVLPDLPRLHDPGHHRGVQRPRAQASRRWCWSARSMGAGRLRMLWDVVAAERDARSCSTGIRTALAPVIHSAGVVRADRGARRASAT